MNEFYVMLKWSAYFNALCDEINSLLIASEEQP